MKNNTKNLAIVGVAGALLLGVGGGYALWSDSAQVNGGTITSGNLDIEAIGTTAVTDITPNRADAGHVINDLATWRAVPADVVQLENDFDVALEGDNLIAALDTSALNAVIPEDARQYVTYTVQLQDANGNIIDPNSGDQYLMQAQRQGQDAGQGVDGIITAPVALDNTADFKAITTIRFDANTPDRVLTQTNLAQLSDQAVSLRQITQNNSPS